MMVCADDNASRNGGGVYALEWSSTGKGIQAWFFPRSSIPANLASEHPDPSTWGTPTAAWPESGCDSSKHFGPQTLIFVSALLYQGPNIH